MSEPEAAPAKDVSSVEEAKKDEAAASSDGTDKIYIPKDMRILVCGPQGAGKTTMIRAFRGRPPFPKYRPTFYQRFTDKFVQVYNKTIDLEIWDAGEEGTIAISEMRFNCIILCVNIAAPQQLEEIPNSQWFKSINGKWADTPKVVVGLRSDYRRGNWASPLMTESQGQTFAETIGAVSYSEMCALTADPQIFRDLFEKVANTIIMSRLHVLPDKEPYQEEFEEEKKKIKGDCAARSIFNALKLWGDREFLGVRDRAPNGKLLNTYSWVTFRKFSHRAEHFGSGLQHLVPSRSFVILSAPNCVEWLAADIGIMKGNMIGVTVHFTTPPDDLIFILGQTKSTVACIGSKLISSFAEVAHEHPYLKYIIQIDKSAIDTEIVEQYKEKLASLGCKLLHFTEVEEIGQDNPHDLQVPGEADLVTIEYTSGSTGKPKGIMQNAKSFSEDVAYVGSGHCTVLWEPLSHSERTNTYRRMMGGGRTAVYNREIGPELFEEFQLMRPTLMVAVPRFWNVLFAEYQKMLTIYRAKLPKRDPKKVESCIKAYFGNILGGNLYVIATGGAPTSKAVYNWMFGLGPYVSESYGAMEVGGIASSKTISKDVEWKIVDVPEMGYTSQDKPYPRGELCVKTTTMAMGYFNNEEETQRSFRDGFFHTGDIVQVEKSQSVRVIDRKKDIFKLSQGEYVSPVRCETVFQTSKFVEQIFVHGDSLHSYLIAIVVPNQGVLIKWAEENGYPQRTLAELCQLREVNEMVLADLKAAALLHKLRSYEYVRRLFLSPERFTVENSQLTATNKPARRGILAAYKDVLDALYKGDEPIGLSGVTSPSSGHSLLRSSGGRKLQQTVGQALAKVGVHSDQPGASKSSLVDLGMDSLSAITLVNTIKKEFDVAVPIETLYKSDMNVDTLVTLLEHQRGKEAWLVDDSSWGTDNDEAYMFDLDPYNFLSDIVPQTPTAPSLEDLLKETEVKKAESTETGTKEASETSGDKKTESSQMESKEAESEKGEETLVGSAALDAVKDSEIKSVRADKSHDASRMVLLTGVTGYLGAFVLEELLKQTKWRVMCLIRAENDDAAIQKLLKHLAKLEIKLPESEMDRVGIILGDLSKPKLGMSDQDYSQYIDAVDEIYHVGAWVNGILPYAVLRPTNVLGTVELIRFALTGQRNRKVFHYVSTLSTMNPFSSEKYNRFIGERAITASQADYFRSMGGYPLSKLVSEVLLTAVADKILDFHVFIYRPGSISGHSQTGAANLEAYINKLICGIIKLGFYPVARNNRYQKDWAPVDYVASSIVHISRRGPVYGIFHMNHPYSIYSLSMERLAQAIRSFGYPVEPLSYNKWRRKLYKDMEREDDPNPLKPLRSYFDGNLQADLCFECKNTLLSLKNDVDAPKCPYITEEILHRYLQYWIRQGTIPKPDELVERYNALKKSI